MDQPEAFALAHQCASVLRDRFGAQRVIVFGSVTRRDRWSSGSSDIDLAVEGLSLRALAQAEEHLRTMVPASLRVDLVEIVKPLRRIAQIPPHHPCQLWIPPTGKPHYRTCPQCRGCLCHNAARHWRICCVARMFGKWGIESRESVLHRPITPSCITPPSCTYHEPHGRG